jgi:ComF family protein
MPLELVRTRRWFQDLLDFVFPPLCLGCGGYLESDGVVCDVCREAVDTFSQPICLNCWQSIPSGSSCQVCRESSFSLFAFGDYIAPLKDIIIQFKFRGMTTAAEYLASGIAAEFRDRILALHPDYLVPIPLHAGREYIRGYNQAEVLASALSRVLEVPVDSAILYRTKKRPPQARLRENERERNIKGVFEAAGETEFGERVILVDDVVTSGSTIREARHILEEAGYRVPGAISIAHGV